MAAPRPPPTRLGPGFRRHNTTIPSRNTSSLLSALARQNFSNIPMPPVTTKEFHEYGTRQTIKQILEHGAFEEEKDKKCLICHDTVETVKAIVSLQDISWSTKHLAVELTCGHKIGSKCILEWFQTPGIVDDGYRCKTKSTWQISSRVHLEYLNALN